MTTQHILGHFGDGGVTAASARIVAAVSAKASSTAQPHSVCGGELCCTTTVDNSGVYLKSIVSVYFTCPARTVGFSGTHLYQSTQESTDLNVEMHMACLFIVRWTVTSSAINSFGPLQAMVTRKCGRWQHLTINSGAKSFMDLHNPGADDFQN